MDLDALAMIDHSECTSNVIQAAYIPPASLGLLYINTQSWAESLLRDVASHHCLLFPPGLLQADVTEQILLACITLVL